MSISTNQIVIIETKSQFILKEEGFENTNNYPEYYLHFPFYASESKTEVFPQFELAVKANGGYGLCRNIQIIYRGFIFTPKNVRNNEHFIISFLNDLKQGDYQNKITKLIEKSVNNEIFQPIIGILQAPNILAIKLEKDMTKLQKEYDTLQTDLKKHEIIWNENQRLKETINKLKEVLDKMH